MHKGRNIGLRGVILVVTLIFFTVISKGLGLVRETLLAYYYGTTKVVDTFVLSTSVPTVVFGCLDAVAVTVVPIYVKRKTLYSQKIATKAFNNVVSWTFTISLIVFAFTEVFSPFIGRVFVKDNQQLELLIIFLRITLFTVIFNPLAQLYLTLLRCDDRQIRAQLFELAISGVQIGFIVLAGVTSNDIFLPLGYLSATVICAFLSYITSGNRFKADWECGDAFYESLELVVPAFLGNTIVQLNAFIDKIFASSLVTGMVSSLNYANIIKNLFYALFTAPIINIYYPRITANISLNDYDKIREELSEVIAFMLMLLVPSTIFCLFYSEEMVKFLFFRGAFNLESLHTTSAAFRMYSIGIVSICLREVLVRCYYSFNKTKEVIMNNIFSVAANIILNAVLIRYMKQTGLALATSLSAIIILPFWIKGVVDENVLSIKSVFFQFFRYTMFSVPIIVEMMVMKMVFVFPDEVLWQIVFFGKVIILAVILYIPAIYMTLIKDKRRIKK